MAPYITNSQNDKVRKKAIDLLAYALIEIPHLMLTEESLFALASFFVDKLTDVVCVLPAVKSLYAILRFHNTIIKNSDPTYPILKTIFLGLSHSNFHVPAYAQKVRYYSFNCYEQICNEFPDHFKGTTEMKSQDLISVVITQVGEEKDPRNLVIAFALYAKILSMYPDEVI
jgi:hypothetical protein